MFKRPVWKALGYTFLMILAFVIPSFFLPSDQMVEIASALLIVACGFTVYRWGQTAARVYLNGASQPYEQGILAIVVMALFLMFGRLYQVTFIRLDRPDWLIDKPISAAITYGLFISLFLAVIATRTEGERPSRGVAIVTGGFTAVAVFASAIWPVLISKAGAIAGFLNRIF